jgi:hypothetical protein
VNLSGFQGSETSEQVLKGAKPQKSALKELRLNENPISRFQR